MPEAEIIKKVTVRLTLTEREAYWLKNLVQNPIGCSFEDELKEARQMREAFWKALVHINPRGDSLHG